MEDLSKILGIAPTAPSTPQSGLQQAMNPMPPEVNASMTPPKDETDLQTRVNGWGQVIERIKTDPNLQRSLMMMGSYLMQPIQPGQSALGQFGGGVAFGSAAYQMGQSAETEAQLAEREQRMKEAESRSQIELRGAQAEGAQLENVRTRRTMESAVAKVIAEADRTLLEVEGMKKDVPLKDKQREFELRKQEILAGLPDTKLRAQAEAEIDKSTIVNELNKALTTKATAEAGEAEARGKYYESGGAKGAMTAYELWRISQMQSNEQVKLQTAQGLVNAVGTAMTTKDKKGKTPSLEDVLLMNGIKLEDYLEAKATVEVKGGRGAKGGAETVKEYSAKDEAEAERITKEATARGEKFKVTVAKPKGTVEKYDREGNPLGAPSAVPSGRPLVPGIQEVRSEMGATNVPSGAIVQKDSEYALRKKALTDALDLIGSRMTPSQARSLLASHGDVMSPGQKLTITLLAQQGPQ